MSNKKSLEIINKIKKENIRPLPKWKANLSNYVYWGFLILLVLFGGVFASFLFIDYFNITPALARHFHLGKFIFIMLRTAPLLWIILLFLSLFFAILAYRSTKKGYRHKITSIIILIVLAISLLGFINHISKINRHMERPFEEHVLPRLGRFAPSREKRFSMPQEGIVAGRIKTIEKNQIIIQNRKQEWAITFSSETEVKGRKPMEIGVMILVFGKKKQENSVFKAKTIITDLPPTHFSRQEKCNGRCAN